MYSSSTVKLDNGENAGRIEPTTINGTALVPARVTPCTTMTTVPLMKLTLCAGMAANSGGCPEVWLTDQRKGLTSSPEMPLMVHPFAPSTTVLVVTPETTAVDTLSTMTRPSIG